MKNTLPPYSASEPFAVSHGHIVEGLDCRSHSTHCCLRAAEEAARYHRACGRLNITITELRPAPVKGGFGGWRLSPGPRPACKCYVAPLCDVDGRVSP